MRILLFGATDLSTAVADHLVVLGMEPVGVVHVGRSFSISYRPHAATNVRFGDVSAWADQHGVPALHYDGAAGARDFAASVGAEFGLLAGWFHMVPRAVREQFARGCAGLHASLLPKFRGGAPLSWALLAGETTTGVSLFELGDGIDDGPLYGRRTFPIGPRSRIAELVTAAEATALDILSECMPALASGDLVPTPQEGTPSYCLQRFPDDGWIDWHRPAAEIDRLVRAVGRPYPGAFTLFRETAVFVWAAEPLTSFEVYGIPGQIARLPGEDDPCVVTGDGVLVLRDASDPAGRPLLGDLRKAAHQRFETRRFPTGSITPVEIS